MGYRGATWVELAKVATHQFTSVVIICRHPHRSGDFQPPNAVLGPLGKRPSTQWLNTNSAELSNAQKTSSVAFWRVAFSASNAAVANARSSSVGVRFKVVR